jgi:hypothetical protein
MLAGRLAQGTAWADRPGKVIPMGTMEFEIISRKDQDLGRGVALMVAGAVMVLLKWVLPAVAPLALAAYAVYRLFMKSYAEAAISFGVAVLLWFLQGLVGWLLLAFGAGMAGFGVFFLVRGMRGKYLIE